MKSKMITVGVLLGGLAISLVSYTNKSNISTYVEENNTEISEGEKLFKANCLACHITTKPEDMSKLIAPPIMGVMMYVKNGIKGKNGAEKRKNAIEFIVDYAQNPSAEKSLLKPHAIERFKLMPSLKESVTIAELTLIANYLYDNFPPKGMKHGAMHKGDKKGGCGADCGDDCKH